MGRNSRIRSLSLGSTNIVLRNRDRENSNEMINLLTKRIVKSSSYDEMKEIQELLMKLKQKLPNVGDGIDELENCWTGMTASIYRRALENWTKCQAQIK
ncbi:unnamed protein product [Dracunculus medinensis]|uniref:Uncharacterized protein n=1 Tax=Dracunculus medinensis TaxID=318479 RepID=A0A0N4UJ80_DRAME|nr:unnamed protein product [Dracunculus medinensis]